MAWTDSSLRRKSLTFVVLALVSGFGPLVCATTLPAQPKPGEPTNPKAQKTYAAAADWEKHDRDDLALDAYRKADKQDGGHCAECLAHAYALALRLKQFQEAVSMVQDHLATAQDDHERALLHFREAMALQWEGLDENKEQAFRASCEEFKAAFALDPGVSSAHFSYGVSLAHVHRDDAARAEFEAFLKQDTAAPELHERAARYLQRIDLARARMAPAFTITTLDGRQVTMDSFAGKVVLIDFWATWCGPCIEALPNLQAIARNFAGQPLVILSISLDRDEKQWKQFVARNHMTWFQYRDGTFDGPFSKAFDVQAVPATFAIDADGVVEDQHLLEANIQSKLKKLVAQAEDKAAQTTLPAASGK